MSTQSLAIFLLLSYESPEHDKNDVYYDDDDDNDPL